jgi:hypothetical protein
LNDDEWHKEKELEEWLVRNVNIGNGIFGVGKDTKK